MAVKIQLRRGTAAEWTSVNPTLLSGEQGLETDTGKTKIGDGVTAWNSLGYAFVPNSLVTAAGQVIASSGSATPAIVPVGTNNYVLQPDSTKSTGLDWKNLLTNLILLSPEERCNVVASAATGTINIDILTAGVWYYTSNATGNHTVNIRGNSGSTLSSILEVGDSVTVVWLNTNGTTAYYPNVIQIDGSSVTPKWQGGTAPSAGNASSIDAYTFTVIKTAATPTYTVLGSQTKFA